MISSYILWNDQNVSWLLSEPRPSCLGCYGTQADESVFHRAVASKIWINQSAFSRLKRLSCRHHMYFNRKSFGIGHFFHWRLHWIFPRIRGFKLTETIRWQILTNEKYKTLHLNWVTCTRQEAPQMLPGRIIAHGGPLKRTSKRSCFEGMAWNFFSPPSATNILKHHIISCHMYGLLTKCEVKMAGYWPSSFFACLWTEMESRSMNSQKKNEANIQPSWLNKLGQ